MICLFSGVGPIGGIQASGLEAWRAFQEIAGRRAIVFGADDSGEVSHCPAQAVVSRSRATLITKIVAQNGAARLPCSGM